MTAPIGSNLTINELLEALKWKLECGDDEQEIQTATKEWNEVFQKQYRHKQFLHQFDMAKQVVKHMTYREASMRAVTTLPIEILTHIFFLLQDNIVAQFPPPTKDELVSWNSWMTVTHVCRRWRQFAIQTSFLWRYIALGADVKCPGSLGMLYIERSDPGPLEINLACGLQVHDKPETRELLQELYNAILKNRARIQGLHLLMEGRKEPMLVLLQEDLPSVSSIHLQYNSGYGGLLFKDGSKPTLFLGPVQKLTLDGFRGLPSNIFSGLTHLALIKQMSKSTMAFTQFLDFLETCPRLEALYLVKAGPVIPAYPERYALRAIRFPFLKHVQIWNPNIPNSPFLLHNLVMPSGVTLIWAFSERLLVARIEDPEVYNSMLPPVTYLEGITNAFVRISERACFKVSNDTLTVELPHVDSEYAYTVGALTRFFPNIISITFDPSFPKIFSFNLLFQSYTRLKILRLSAHHSSLKAFFTRLDELDQDDDFANERDGPLLPSLSAFVIHVRFDRFDEGEDTSEEFRLSKIRETVLSWGNFEEDPASSAITQRRERIGAPYTLKLTADRLVSPDAASFLRW